jgi:hypothetical protein
MKNIILAIAISVIATSCKNEKLKLRSSDALFYDCEYKIDWNNAPKSDKWIDDVQGAKDNALIFEDVRLNERNPDSLYKGIAQYIFAIGGGGIYVPAKKCTANIQKDSITIYYDPIYNQAEVGEMAISRICMEIDKIKYPNYKGMKIKFVQNNLND